jgi:hypothetical protein
VKAPSNTESKNKKKNRKDGKEGPIGPYTEAYTTPGTQNINKRNPDSLK